MEYQRERREKEKRALARDLRRAADQGDLPALQRALALGAAVDCVDCSGFTALHLAAEKGHTDIVEALLVQGACVNQKEDISGWTPLHAAAYAAQSKVLPILVKHGASVECVDHGGAPPMLLACRSGCVETVRTLHHHNATIFVKQSDGTDAWGALETNGEMTVEERQRMLDLLESLAASSCCAAK